MTPDDRSADISGVVDELRAELERLPPAEGGEQPAPGAPADLAPALRRMRDTASITADHPPTVRAGRLAPGRRSVKLGLRKLMRWYVERLAVDVREFAEASTAMSAGLAGRLAEAEERERVLAAQLEARIARLEEAHARSSEALAADMDRSLAGLRDRIGRVERGARPAAPGPRPAAPAGAPAPAGPAVAGATSGGAHVFDYFGFETLMRGSREDIAERQRAYVGLFTGAGEVLDVGCGRGEFLALLGAAGVRARGIDIDADMVAQCRAEGLEAEQAEAVAHLRGLAPGSLGGLFAAQVVEHLRPPALVDLLDAAHAALAPGGVLVLETINPGSLSALRNYFADLTHAQPLVPETLRFLVESAGFSDARVELRSPVPDAGRLQQVPYGDVVPEEARVVAGRNVDLLNGLLFAPQDYSVTARA